MPYPIPNLQTAPAAGSNVAAKIMQSLQSKPAAGSGAGNSNAAVRLMELKSKENEAFLERQINAKNLEREQEIAMNEYGANLLSNVSSQEDLDIVKRQFIARYPEMGAQIDKILPKYDERSVYLIREGLLTETERMKRDEAANKMAGYSPGTEVWQGSKKVGSVPFAPTSDPGETVKGFSPGSHIYKGENKIGSVPANPSAASKDDFMLFRNVDGDEVFIKEGNAIPKGYRKWEATKDKKGVPVRGFAPGSDIYEGNKKIGSVPNKPVTPPKGANPSWDLFEDADGNQSYQQKGSVIPDGLTKVGGSNTTNVTVNTGNTPTTKTRLQKDIMEATRNVQSFRKTGELFEDSFLTYWGKGKDVVTSQMDKLGISTGDQKSFINRRQKWFRRAKADFIAYRKWATGVAGGPQELKEIATSFPDPVKNSPEKYRANLESIEDVTRDILMLNKDFLESGIDPNQPLDAIFTEMKDKKLGIKLPPGAEAGGKTKVLRFDSDGNPAESNVYSGRMTDAENAQIDSDLDSRYGISALKDTDKVYKELVKGGRVLSVKTLESMVDKKKISFNTALATFKKLEKHFGPK